MDILTALKQEEKPGQMAKCDKREDDAGNEQKCLVDSGDAHEKDYKLKKVFFSCKAPTASSNVTAI
jgi:hypothetical protein